MSDAERRILCFVICSLLLLCLPAFADASQERRTALVVGNGAYESGRLGNPVNDAADMAAALRRSGFEVILRQNIRLREMEDALEDFGRRLRRGGVGLFYFAGHGVQTGGANYLLPIGARIRRESDVRHEALSAERVLDEMADANNGLNIVLLDACRDNPFFKTFRSATRGLAVLDRAPEGTFISYATGPGQVARDGEGRNSPYTGALLKQMAVPGLPIEQVFKNVRLQLSALKQTPWELSSLKGDFSFLPGAAVSDPAPAPMKSPVAPSGTDQPPSVAPPPKPADDLDLLVAQVQRKREEDERVKREAREAEERKKEERDRRFLGLLDDLKKYEAVRSADVGAEMKVAAWDALARKYPSWSYGIARGDEGQLLARAVEEDNSGTWAETALKAGHLVRTKSRILGAAFVPILPGSFTMGSPSDEPGRYNDETQHRVTIGKPYYMQTTEVTQGQWKKVMGINPSHFKNCGDDCPVESVSWDDVQEFIRKLNSLEGTDRYRLPTEAEWEYAARAGTTTPFHTGRCLSTDEANYDGNYPLEGCPAGKYRQGPVKAGSFPPNGWGLHDMHGNVWEWVQDWRGDYPSGSVTDPAGPSSGSARVIRGGSWNDFARYCRSAFRNVIAPGIRDDVIGFRLARTK